MRTVQDLDLFCQIILESHTPIRVHFRVQQFRLTGYIAHTLGAVEWCQCMASLVHRLGVYSKLEPEGPLRNITAMPEERLAKKCIRSLRNNCEVSIKLVDSFQYLIKVQVLLTHLMASSGV